MGDCNTARPGMFDMTGRAMWDAWNEKKGQKQDEAQKAYVELLGKHGVVIPDNDISSDDMGSIQDEDHALQVPDFQRRGSSMIDRLMMPESVLDEQDHAFLEEQKSTDTSAVTSEIQQSEYELMDDLVIDDAILKDVGLVSKNKVIQTGVETMLNLRRKQSDISKSLSDE